MLLSRSLTLAVLGLALVAGGCDRQTQQQVQPQAASSTPVSGAVLDRSHKGSALPDYTVKDQAGRELRLQSLIGKPLLINLWATWCAPCIAELPLLDKLAAGGTVKVLTVSQDLPSTADKVAPFLAQRGLKQLEPWLDPKGDLLFKFQAQTLPASIYYDAQGREVWRFIGDRDWTSAETAKLLAEAL